MSGPGSSPQPPAGPPPSGSWTPSPPPQPGPAGLVYADVPNRVIAIIIDGIILAVIGFIVGAILDAVGIDPWTVNPNATTIGDLLSYNPVAGLIQAVIGLIISAGYFIYSWTSLRGTLGQKALSMQVGNAADGATLTMNQAVIRWAALFAPSAVAQAFYPWPTLGTILGLLVFIYAIALLVTTAQSPTKQGLHDQWAKSVVVKAARSVS